MDKLASPNDTSAMSEHYEILSDEEIAAMANRLYATYVKPLEREHWGRFAAVSPDGRWLLGDTSADVGQRASEALGPGNFVFGIGVRAGMRTGARLKRRRSLP